MSVPAMTLDLTRITGDQEPLDRTWPAEAFDTTEEDYGVTGPVRLAATVRRRGERVQLDGTVTAMLELTCCRCLEPLPWPVDSAFSLEYLPQVQNTGEGELEVQEEDLGTAYYSGESIDLAQLLREQFYLLLPMKPLCREDCQGLCPQCGANRNIADCGHRPAWEDPRFAGLKALLDKESNPPN